MPRRDTVTSSGKAGLGGPAGPSRCMGQMLRSRGRSPACWFSQPSSRSPKGTATRPRLRSMKNLGWGLGGDTQDVLYLVARQAELCGDRIAGLSGEKQVDDVIDLRAPAG